jgi:hypothetical protein
MMMNRPSDRMTAAQAKVAHTPNLGGQSGSAASAHALRSAAASSAGPAALQLQILKARVDALEAQLAQLQACAVQQSPDGRLHLPAGNRLRIEIGTTRLTMDLTTFNVQANGQVLVDSSPASRPAGTTPGAQTLAGSASSAGSWQAQASANGVDNPRNLSSGLPLGARP